MTKSKYGQVFLVCLFISSWQAMAAPWVGQALNGLNCAGTSQGYGPYDYTKRANIDKYRLDIVEGAHFTYEVEGLIKGKSGYLTGDLDYTLIAWPNHHRALKSIIRYQLEVNAKIRKGKLNSPAECYFERAINFSPKDTTALRMYGYFLKKSGYIQKAKEIYQRALRIAPNNRAVAYSYGLLLIDLKEYSEALKYARMVYKTGKSPDKLKNKLVRLGIWED